MNILTLVNSVPALAAAEVFVAALVEAEDSSAAEVIFEDAKSSWRFCRGRIANGERQGASRRCRAETRISEAMLLEPAYIARTAINRVSEGRMRATFPRLRFGFR